METDRHAERAHPLTATVFHVLVVLADESLYGYAIMKAVERESGGTVSPEIGSLYRILARLVGEGFVEEADAPVGATVEHRGRRRRYYRLTTEGRLAVTEESRRLRDVLELARERRLLPEASG